MDTSKLQPIMQKFVALIDANNGELRKALEKGLETCHRNKVVEYADIRTLDDYITWNDNNLTRPWLENRYGTACLEKFKTMYYLLDVAPVGQYQNPTLPRPVDPALTPLSEWMREYQIELGHWMDDPKQMTPEVEKSFFNAATYNMDEYIRPHGGWKTVNQLFARNYKPGYRPIAAIADPRVIVTAAESTFAGQWEVNSNTAVNIKGLYWQIQELLQGSQYKDAFQGGKWTHSFLNTFDYHRQHAPVPGTIVESRVIQGAVYVQMELAPVEGSKDLQRILGKTVAVNPDASKEFKITAPDSAGYEFMQTRGIIIIDSPIGLVAVCPIGMGEVSSVITTAEVGRTLHKGEEISYFQFGGSDCCMVFQEKSNVSFTATEGVHYKVGSRIAQAFPVIDPFA
ncbi:MAG: phosphatidylserine decarboxylase [Muribaculaceae bacterium]|nr:phosphatidylserine decarboxylase [Muribaculaceae bacterium]